MSETTNIEWATSTGNPWIGCTKVSPGCKNCYAAEMDANRFSRTMGGGTPERPVSHWGKGAPRFKTKGFWKDAVKWNKEAGFSANMVGLESPKPAPRIFPSLCDWLDDEVPIEWLADFLKLIHDTPNLDWLLLTKRPENFGRIKKAWECLYHAGHIDAALMVDRWTERAVVIPPPNVWIGVSIEDQKRADERIPLLLRIPARVRFLSVEPLLEKVDLHLSDSSEDRIWRRTHGGSYERQFINWVIVGGESGKDRRDCGVESIVDVARQCQAAGVPCFVKQDAAFKPGQQGRIPDDVWALKEFPLTDKNK